MTYFTLPVSTYSFRISGITLVKWRRQKGALVVGELDQGYFRIGGS